MRVALFLAGTDSFLHPPLSSCYVLSGLFGGSDV